MVTTADRPGAARTEVVRLPGGGSLWVVRAEGGVRDAEHPALRAVARSGPEHDAAVLDLALVPLVTAPGVRALVHHAHDLTERGSSLLVATDDPRTRDRLTADTTLTVVPTVAAAAAACGAPDTTPPAPGLDPASDSGNSPSRGRTDGADPELARLRQEVRHLRARARTHPLVSRAQGILEERYRLPDERAAFALLEASSQRFNVRLRTLASAVVTVPRPRSPDHEWFPRRERQAPPALAFQPGLRAATANTSEVLSAVLRRSMEITDASMGNVQLVDPVTGDLRLEKHHGLDDDFVDFFDRVSHEGTACALAAEHLARVTVTDVATDAAFTESARKAILATGSRGCHSTPLLAPRGRVEGMVSTHHERPVHALSAAQARALDEIGDQAGRWLEWYQRTVVLDALEHLHFTGSTWG